MSVTSDNLGVEMPEAKHESVHVLLGRVLKDLPAVGKDGRNEQQRFSFRSVEGILAAAKPVFGRHGVFVVPEVLECRQSEKQGKNSVGTLTMLHVRFTFYGPAGDSVVASTWGEGLDYGDKSCSKAHTMAFKTVLAQVLSVADVEDPDTESHDPIETAEATVTKGLNVPVGPPRSPNGDAKRVRTVKAPTLGPVPVRASEGVSPSMTDATAAVREKLMVKHGGDIDAVVGFLKDNYGVTKLSDMPGLVLSRLYDELQAAEEADAFLG